MKTCRGDSLLIPGSKRRHLKITTQAQMTRSLGDQQTESRLLPLGGPLLPFPPLDSINPCTFISRALGVLSLLGRKGREGIMYSLE